MRCLFYKSRKRRKYNKYLTNHSRWRLFRVNETQSTKPQNTTTTTAVKNSNWPEANQLAIYNCFREVKPGTIRNKFNEWSERVLNPGTPELVNNVPRSSTFDRITRRSLARKHKYRSYLRYTFKSKHVVCNTFPKAWMNR